MKWRNNYQKHLRDIYAISIANTILTEIGIVLFYLRFPRPRLDLEIPQSTQYPSLLFFCKST